VKSLVLLALVACKSSEPPPQPPPSPIQSDAALVDPVLAMRALEKKLVLYELLREVKVEAEASTAPLDDVAGLDFTKQGNTIVVYKATNMPFVTVSKARRFEMFEFEDDVFEIASAVNGIGREDAGSPAQYAARKLEPALEQMVRSTYVVFLFAAQDQPLLQGSSYSPGTLTATGLLYEISTKQVRGRFQFSARNTELTLVGGNDASNYDKLMDDLEQQARAALWAAIKQRFPSAKTP
jgi:hypothetical protein